MDKLALSLIAMLIGALIGFSLTFIFNILPEKWLQDYGYDPNSPSFRLSKRMKVIPHGAVSAFLCAITFTFATYFSYEHLFAPVKPLHIITVFLTIPVVTLVLFADRLNRIIPDQFSIALLGIAIIGIAADLLEGSLWFSEEASWYHIILVKIIGGAIGFGVLWLIGFVAESFLGRESMGQGDMKLLGACGLITGAYGLIVIIYVAAITSLIVAIPLLINKRIRIANENNAIKNSANPVEARRKLNKQKAQMHFADNPDYIAFGPFLAIGAMAFLILEPVFYDILIGYIATFGWYF